MRSTLRFPTLGLLLVLAACTSGGSSDELRLSTEPTVHTGEKALMNGNPELALKIASAILVHQPVNVDALTLRGDAQFGLGHTEQAATSYQQALKYDRNTQRALLGMGRIRLQTDPAAAEAMFIKVLGQEPRNGTALNDLGIACDLQNRHADAQENYRKVLALEPDNSSAQINLGLSLAMSGDKAGALELLQPLSQNPAATQRMQQNLAAALTTAGDPRGAARVMNAQANGATAANDVR